MSHLHVALLLITALDITALYTAALGWLHSLDKRLAVPVASCTRSGLGPDSNRPS